MHKIIDSNTFSNSKASQNLINMLNQAQYKLFSKKIFSILSKYFSYTSSIMYIPDKTVRDMMLKLTTDFFKNRVKDEAFPEIIRTHMLNVISTQFKQCIKENNPRMGNSKTVRWYKLFRE